MASANVVKTLSWKTANIILDMDIMCGTSVFSEKTYLPSIMFKTKISCDNWALVERTTTNFLEPLVRFPKHTVILSDDNYIMISFISPRSQLCSFRVSVVDI